MLLLIVLFPLLGFLFAILFGRALGAKGAVLVTTTFIGFSFLLSLYGFLLVSLNQTVFLYDLVSWFSTSIIISNLGFYV